MAKELSILLPTRRPEQLPGCVESLRAAAEGLDYEIVIVADFMDEEPLARVTWVCEPPKGPVAAICEAEKWAVGDYLFLLSDENRLKAGALTKLHQLAEESWAKGEKVCFSPWFSKEAAGWSYYNRVFPPFPFIRRSWAKELGGLLDPQYGAHYADPDLGMRIWEAGGEVRLISACPIVHDNNLGDPVHVANREQWFERDELTFKGKWGHLGGVDGRF